MMMLSWIFKTEKIVWRRAWRIGAPPSYLALSLLLSLMLLSNSPIAHAQDLQLMEAINAMMMGNPTPTQEALVVYHNRAINQMALRGKISDAAYQASQRHFTMVNNSAIRDSAGAGGMVAKLQPSSGGKHNPGTDTDVLAESIDPRKKLTLENFQAADDAHQQNLRRYFKRKGFDAPPGRINVETDFMPVRASVTDAEFTRINQYINQRGGTAYTRPGSADIEFQMRTRASNPGAKFNLLDTGEYISEMQELAGHKFLEANKAEANARRLAQTNPAAAEAELAEAQLLRSQGSKYLQRMDNLTNAIAEQHGLPPIKKPLDALGRNRDMIPDSLDNAVRNIDKNKRGVLTADDAALVGELGELGIGKGLLNYTNKLSEIAATQPSKLGAIQSIIAEQAANLPPSMRESLLLRATKAYEAAGGTPYGKVSFLRRLINLSENPAARATARTQLASGAVPAGISSAARVAGAVDGAITVATVYLQYQACIDEGRSKKECDAELQHVIKTTAIVGGTLFGAAQSLIALGVLAPSTLVSVGSLLAIAGLPLSLYAGYEAAIDWAHAPEKTALTMQYAMEKEFLMRYGESAAHAQSKLASMHMLHSNAAVMCMQLVNRGKASKLLIETSNTLRAQWMAALGDKLIASDSCEEQGESMGRIFELAKGSKENESKAIEQLDEANALAEKCNSAEKAERILQLMESSQAISTQMQAATAQAHDYNNQIGRKDEAELAQRFKTAEVMRDRMFANKRHLASQLQEMRALQGEMHLLIERYSSTRDDVVVQFGLMSQAHPKAAPSPLYQVEFFNANALQTRLEKAFGGFPDTLTCPVGDSEASKMLTADLIVDGQFDELDQRHINLRDETHSCAGVERQDKTVGDIAASSNWVRAAMDINSPLLQKAEACRRKFKGKLGTTTSACPANAVSVWNPAQQKNLCQCADNFILGSDKKSCIPKPEPVVIACNSTTKAGTNPPQTIVVNVGRNAGTATFQYQMFDVPDHMMVQYGGQVVADTGCVSGGKSLPLVLSGASEQVTIVVQPACRKSDRTEWNFTLSCPSAEPGGAAGAQGQLNAGQFSLEAVNGQVSVDAANGTPSLSLNTSTKLIYGMQIRTGSDGQVVIKSPHDMRLTMGQNTQIRLGESNADKQYVTLERGTLDLYRDSTKPGKDDVVVNVQSGSAQALDTRYRMVRTDRGTEVFVYEGSVHLKGRYIYRTYAANVEAGKPSPVQDLILRAGERALIVDTDVFAPNPASTSAAAASAGGTASAEAPPPPLRPSNPQRPGDDRLAEAVTPPLTRVVRTAPVTPDVAAQAPGRGVADLHAPAASATAVLSSPDPWNDARVQSLMDQWLRTATPVIAASRPGQFSYSEWGQIKGPGITIAGAPDHPAGWSRYQSMWAVRMKFDSLNLCTLGEFIERQIAGKSMDGCQKAVTKPQTLPDWMAPPTQPSQVADRRSEEALTLARTAVNRREADIAATQDFSGEWGCDVRDPEGVSSLFPTITRSGNGYTVSTVTSGMEGMLNAHSVRIEGGKLIAVHQFRLTNGTLTISLTKNGSKLSGVYQASRSGSPVETLPIERCEQVKEPTAAPAPAPARVVTPSPVINTPKVASLFAQIMAIPDEDWVGSKPPLGSDGRSVFALVSELNDKRTNACAYEAKRKGWNVVGFSSRLSLQHAQYPSAPNFPLILGSKARNMIYTIHMAAGRSDVPIPFATAYLIDPTGRIAQQGICYEMLKIDFGVSEGKK